MSTTANKTNNSDNSELALVPENILKKRHDLEELKRKREAHEELHGGKPKYARRRSTSGNNNAAKKSFYVIKPETILAQARTRRNQEIRFKRVQKKGMQKRASNRPTFAVKPIQEDESTLTELKYQSNSVGANMVFCVRVRDSVATSKRIRSTLQRFHLNDIHDGVFVRYTEANRRLLHCVEPYVVYGPPSNFTVQDLLERRGHCKVDDQRVPLSDNTVIERALGDEYGILCVEDLVHELVTTGEHFDEVRRFLWPFRLADAKTSFERRTLKLKDGKHYGDIGEAINDYVQQVL